MAMFGVFVARTQGKDVVQGKTKDGTTAGRRSDVPGRKQPFPIVGEDRFLVHTENRGGLFGRHFVGQVQLLLDRGG